MPVTTKCPTKLDTALQAAYHRTNPTQTILGCHGGLLLNGTFAGKPRCVLLFGDVHGPDVATEAPNWRTASPGKTTTNLEFYKAIAAAAAARSECVEIMLETPLFRELAPRPSGHLSGLTMVRHELRACLRKDGECALGCRFPRVLALDLRLYDPAVMLRLHQTQTAFARGSDARKWFEFFVDSSRCQGHRWWQRLQDQVFDGVAAEQVQNFVANQTGAVCSVLRQYESYLSPQQVQDARLAVVEAHVAAYDHTMHTEGEVPWIALAAIQVDYYTVLRILASSKCTRFVAQMGTAHTLVVALALMVLTAGIPLTKQHRLRLRTWWVTTYATLYDRVFERSSFQDNRLRVADAYRWADRLSCCVFRSVGDLIAAVFE